METLTLGALLFTQMPDLRSSSLLMSRAHTLCVVVVVFLVLKFHFPTLPFRLQSGLWWPNQDVTGALGLQFQWPGSHTNTILLRCLSVNKRDKVSLNKPQEQDVIFFFFFFSQGGRKNTAIIHLSKFI